MEAEKEKTAANQKRLGEIQRGWGWIEEDKQVAEAKASGLRERAVRLLQAAGIEYQSGRPWTEYVERFSERARGAQRLTLLIDELSRRPSAGCSRRAGWPSSRPSSR